MGPMSPSLDAERGAGANRWGGAVVMTVFPFSSSPASAMRVAPASGSAWTLV
jgi:hypothetical protein